MTGFSRARALSTRHNDAPGTASRPFDSQRDGFVISEGAVVVMLEERRAAIARGAPILAEMVGYGLACDASHITAPRTDGLGAVRAMRGALSDSGLPAHAVGHIAAHATSTPLGDAAEAAAISTLLVASDSAQSAAGERPLVAQMQGEPSPHDGAMAGALAASKRGGGGGPSGAVTSVASTKGSFGHLLGAAGGVNAVAAVLAVHHGTTEPSFNMVESDVEFDPSVASLTLVRDASDPIRVALSNAFGFGGTNTSLCFVSHPSHGTAQ
jgi:3-oxoacyl-[acyl-carrier-protein] synthase II